MPVLKTTKYLVFTLIYDSGKTYTVQVSNLAGVDLGLIKWVGAWRTYCFMPACDTQFDSRCIADIQFFIHELLMKRKVLREESPGK
jgi:hypothetical protein